MEHNNILNINSVWPDSIRRQEMQLNETDFFLNMGFREWAKLYEFVPIIPSNDRYMIFCSTWKIVTATPWEKQKKS